MIEWQGKARCTVFDAEHGDGARLRELIERWRQDPQRPARLHYIGLAAHALPGMRRLPQPDDALTVDLLSSPALLAQLDARLDAIFLHDLAVSAPLAHALGKLARPGARLTANALTREQTAALAHAGFAFDAPGQARYASRRPQPPASQPERRAIVLGAGLAGCAASERLCARGWQVTLVERHERPASEASGNMAGIRMPLLSRDDNLMTRLARAAFLYALAYSGELGGAGPGARCGVLQLARDGAHAQVQRAIAAAHAYPADFAQWLEAPAASAMFKRSAPHGAWWFPQGGWVHPASLCAAMLAACGGALEQRFGTGSVQIDSAAGGWRVLAAGGAVLAEAPVLIVASGGGAHALAQTAALPLASVRGQVTHLAEGSAPALPFVLCREAYLTPASQGYNSLGASYDDDNDSALRAASQADNLAKLAAMLGQPGLGRDAPLAGRVGFRSVAPDRLPLVGALPDHAAAARCARLERLRDVPRHAGLYGLLGYASRGLIWAPLAAELLAAQLEGEPLPLERELVQALDPGRFALRARKKLWLDTTKFAGQDA